MCKELLTSKTAWYSDRCSTTWKVKVSKSNVSLFQLRASVHGTKGTESGLWLTPSTMDISQRSPDAMQRRIKMRAKSNRKSIPPGSLSEQIQTGRPIKDMREVMYPTPTVVCEEGGEQSHLIERTKSGSLVARRKGSGKTYGAKLSDAMLYLEKEKKMYHTPTRSDYKDAAYNPITCKTDLMQIKLPHQVLANNKPGGRLNPLFVEFLMGFPMNWTKIEQAESKPSETISAELRQIGRAHV